MLSEVGSLVSVWLRSWRKPESCLGKIYKYVKMYKNKILEQGSLKNIFCERIASKLPQTD